MIRHERMGDPVHQKISMIDFEGSIGVKMKVYIDKTHMIDNRAGMRYRIAWMGPIGRQVSLGESQHPYGRKNTLRLGKDWPADRSEWFNDACCDIIVPIDRATILRRLRAQGLHQLTGYYQAPWYFLSPLNCVSPLTILNAPSMAIHSL
ncbi:hypothetical protein [Herpetosiphon gulosus]|uniref:Uncharacterized protein n=1 Tax=Herpetosiphon gulosus TaxID=1973496 RepID=A0ABP9X752_9CHLR